MPVQFFETSALLIFFVTLGKLLENIAKGKTSGAIAKLMSLQAPDCILLEALEGTQTNTDIYNIQHT